jgi:hypothetical protein
MNYKDYLCNSIAVMLMNSMSQYSIEFEYDEEENPNYDRVYNQEKSDRIDRLAEEAFNQCVKDYEMFAESNEQTNDVYEFCNQMVYEQYDEIVEQAENEIRALGIKSYFINEYDIKTADQYAVQLLKISYHNVDDYGYVDRYYISQFSMNSGPSDEEGYDHIVYWNNLWSSSYNAHKLKVFL